MAATSTRTSPAVRLEIQDDIAIVRMVSGENRWNLPFSLDFKKVLDQVESNLSVKCMVITGEGKFFSYGLDLPWMVQQTSDVLLEFLAAMDHVTMKIATFPMPTIAGLNGHAYGMGAVLAMACDYRIMRTGRGWFNFPETKLKLKFTSQTLEVVRLKLTNFQTLRDAIIYAKRYTAEEALKAQIVDEVVDIRDLLPAAIRIGKELVGDGLDRDTVAACKDKLFGIPMRAARERDQKTTNQHFTNARLQAFKQGAALLPSKM